MKNITYQKILIVIFLIVISLPLTLNILGIDRLTTLNENRQLSKRPKLELNNILSYPPSLVNYFSDNFGFRDILIKANSNLKFNFLKTSPSSDVVIGENGWFFFTPDTNYVEQLNIQPFSASELSQIKQNLKQANDYFNKNGAEFIVFIAPNSQSIYPEYLPQFLQTKENSSKLDQLTSYLSHSHTKFNYIDLKHSLISAKGSGQLYYKYDLHWNSLGAFFAYQELFLNLEQDLPGLKAKDLSDFQISYQQTKQKDLENILGLTGYFNETEPILTPKLPTKIINSSVDCPDIHQRCAQIVEQSNTGNLKLVMFRDSFGAWLIPYISPHFQKSTYLWGPMPFPTEIVKEEKPDIVIFEITERSIQTLKDKVFNLN